MKKQNFLKGSFILMASAVIAKGLGAVFRIPLTNILGGVGMSYFSAAYSIFMPVYALTVSGLSSACARMTARSCALGMYANAARIRRVALGIFSAAGLLGALGIWLFSAPLSRMSTGDTQAAIAIAMIAPSVFFGCITAVERGCFEGQSNMYPTAVSQTVEGAVKAAAGLALAFYVSRNAGGLARYSFGITDMRALSAAAGILGVTLSSASAVVYFMVRRAFVRHEGNISGERHLERRRSIASELFRTALPVGVNSLVTNLTAIIDMWTIIQLSGRTAPHIPGVTAEEVPRFMYGSYAGIALTVFNLVPSVTNMLGKGILPPITEAWEKGDREGLSRSSLHGLVTAAAIAVPAAVGLGVLARPVVMLLFPEQHDEAELCVMPLTWLMPGMVCLCLSYPLFAMLQGIGRASAPLKITAAGTLVKLVGNVLLIPEMGLTGAAVSTTISFAVILFAAAAVYCRASGLRPEFTPFLAVLYAGGMCGGGAYLAYSLAERGGLPLLWSLIFAISAGGIAYLATAYIVFSIKKENAILLRRSQKLS